MTGKSLACSVTKFTRTLLLPLLLWFCNLGAGTGKWACLAEHYSVLDVLRSIIHCIILLSSNTEYGLRGRADGVIPSPAR